MLEAFLSDIHFPFEDKLVYPLSLDVLLTHPPDLLFLGGDIFDMYPISTFDKDPKRKDDLQDEIDYNVGRLKELRNLLPNTRIEFLEGNHELRLRRYLSQRAPALQNLEALTIPKLFHLDDLEIGFNPNTTKIQIGQVWHIHGNEVKGDIKRRHKKLNTSFIYGHSHFRDYYQVRKYGSDEFDRVIQNPCLCDMNPEYDVNAQWTQGFTFLEHNDSTGTFKYHPVDFQRTHTVHGTKIESNEVFGTSFSSLGEF